MSAKAEIFMRQQYLVPRKSVKKLREMSRREGVSRVSSRVGPLRPTRPGTFSPSPKKRWLRARCSETAHTQVRATLARIDASLSEIRARASACRWQLPCPGGCRDQGVVRCTSRGGARDRGALRAAGERMSRSPK